MYRVQLKKSNFFLYVLETEIETLETFEILSDFFPKCFLQKEMQASKGLVRY